VFPPDKTEFALENAKEACILAALEAAAEPDIAAWEELSAAKEAATPIVSALVGEPVARVAAPANATRRPAAVCQIFPDFHVRKLLIITFSKL